MEMDIWEPLCFGAVLLPNEIYTVTDRSVKLDSGNMFSWFYLDGVPIMIIHDKAAKFLSDIVQETAIILEWHNLQYLGHLVKVGRIRTLERMNRTLKQMLMVVTKNENNWNELLGPVLFAYRTALPTDLNWEDTFLICAWPWCKSYRFFPATSSCSCNRGWGGGGCSKNKMLKVEPRPS